MSLRTTLTRKTKFKAFCFIESFKPVEDAVFDLYRTKRDALQAHRSYFGHHCDDPLKRGVICECEIRIRVPKRVPRARASKKELIDYVRKFMGMPVLIVDGVPVGIAKTRREQRMALSHLAKA